MAHSFRLYVMLVLASVADARYSPRTDFEAGVLRLVEKCKAGDVWSLPVQLPSLNPLKLPGRKINREDYSLSLSELTVNGLENLSVERLSASPHDMSMSIEIYVPSLTVSADYYHLKAGRFLIFQFVNNVGQFRCYINSLVGRGEVKFGAYGRDTVITSLDIDFSIQNVQVELTGSSSQVNQRANRRIWNLINDREFAGRVEGLIKQRARQYLRGHTPEEFAQIISNI